MMSCFPQRNHFILYIFTHVRDVQLAYKGHKRCVSAGALGCPWQSLAVPLARALPWLFGWGTGAPLRCSS